MARCRLLTAAAAEARSARTDPRHGSDGAGRNSAPSPAPIHAYTHAQADTHAQACTGTCCQAQAQARTSARARTRIRDRARTEDRARIQAQACTDDRTTRTQVQNSTDARART